MLSGLIWNARGIGNQPTIRRISNLQREHRLMFIAILEPMIDVNRIHLVCRKLGMDKCCSNGEGVTQIG